MDNIPETIIIKEGEFTKKRIGPPTTEQRRRKNHAKLKAEGKATGNRNHYTDKEKMEVACTYAVTGNSRRTSELTGVPEGTIRSFKLTEWWSDIQSRIIKEQDEELSTKLTRVVDKVVDEVNDRLEHGDYVYNARTEQLVRKPVGAKDLSIVGAVFIDKRELLRGKPTSRVEKVSQEETLSRLAADFKKFANAKTVTQEPETK